MSLTEAVSEPTAPQVLGRLLAQVRRRVFLDRLLTNLTFDLILASIAWVVLLAVDRTLFSGVADGPRVATLLGATVTVSFLRSILRGRPSRHDAALLADHRLLLKERVSSAVYLEEKLSGDAELRRLVEVDAARAVGGASVAESFPIRIPRFAAWLLVPLVLGVALHLWLPTFDLLSRGLRREVLADEEKLVSEEKRKLEEKFQELLKQAQEKELPDAQNVLELVSAQQQSNANVEKKDGAHAEKAEKTSSEPRKEAMVEMSRREDALRKGLENQKFDPLKEARKTLRALDLKSADLTRKLQEALKDGDFDKARKELEDLKADLSKLSEKRPSDLTEEERARLQKLSEELGKLAKDSKSLSRFSKALSRASESLGAQGLNSQKMSDSLESLSQSMEDLQSLLKLAQQVEMLDQALELVQLSKEELANLHNCPDCGKSKVGSKPGGT